MANLSQKLRHFAAENSVHEEMLIVFHSLYPVGADVNVALFRDWIDQQFQFRKLDTRFYNIE